MGKKQQEEKGGMCMTDFGSLPDFVNAKTACEILSLSRSKIAQLARTGEIEAFRAGREWRFRTDSLLEYAGVDRGGRQESEEGPCNDASDEALDLCRDMLSRGYIPTQWSIAPSGHAAKGARLG